MPLKRKPAPEPDEAPDRQALLISRRARFEQDCIGEYVRLGLLENEAVDLIEAGVSIGAFVSLLNKGCPPREAAKILL